MISSNATQGEEQYTLEVDEILQNDEMITDPNEKVSGIKNCVHTETSSPLMDEIVMLTGTETVLIDHLKEAGKPVMQNETERVPNDKMPGEECIAQNEDPRSLMEDLMAADGKDIIDDHQVMDTNEKDVFSLLLTSEEWENVKPGTSDTHLRDHAQIFRCHLNNLG